MNRKDSKKFLAKQLMLLTSVKTNINTTAELKAGTGEKGSTAYQVTPVTVVYTIHFVFSVTKIYNYPSSLTRFESSYSTASQCLILKQSTHRCAFFIAENLVIMN